MGIFNQLSKFAINNLSEIIHKPGEPQPWPLPRPKPSEPKPWPWPWPKPGESKPVPWPWPWRKR